MTKFNYPTIPGSNTPRPGIVCKMLQRSAIIAFTRFIDWWQKGRNGWGGELAKFWNQTRARRLLYYSLAVAHLDRKPFNLSTVCATKGIDRSNASKILEEAKAAGMLNADNSLTTTSEEAHFANMAELFRDTHFNMFTNSFAASRMMMSNQRHYDAMEDDETV